MLVVALANMSLGRLTTHALQSDRAGILGASALGVVFCIPLFNFGTSAVSVQAALLGVGSVLIVTVAGTDRGFGLALATKLTPARLKPYMNLYASMSSAIGLGTGSLVGSVLSP